MDENILYALFWLHYPQMKKQNVCWPLENADQSVNPITSFVPSLILLIDTYSTYLFFWNQISIVSIAFLCLELTELLMEHGVLYQLFQMSLHLLNWQSEKFANQTKIRFISQLIRSISRVLQKWLKYFDDAVISTSYVLPPTRVLPVFCLEFE